MTQVEIVGGHYAFKLPTSFFPNYRKFGMRGEPYPYEFNYEARIISDGRITQLSIPKNARMAEWNEERTNILIRSMQPHRTCDLYYRTSDMMTPQLLYAVSEDGTEAAFSATLVPTFDSPAAAT